MHPTIQKTFGVLLTLAMLAGCGDNGSNTGEIQATTQHEMKIENVNEGQHEMKIENVNEGTGSFDIVDARTKKILSYNKIMINNQNVVSTKNMSMMGASFVFFNYDKITAAGKEIANIGIRAESPYGYELTAGILNIIVDNLPEASNNAPVEKKEEKSTIKFKGGACVYEGVDYSSEEKRFSLILHYTLDKNASTAALTVLNKGVIKTSEGKTYKMNKSFSNSEYSLYRMDYHFPDAVRQGISFKYVLNGQEIPITFH
ncbi:MAG: hypothetical protein FWH56_08590 [Betaproteobacteria bacterium]|nr:hypothetical protein [Betaproteobacteria bacterium]